MDRHKMRRKTTDKTKPLMMSQGLIIKFNVASRISVSLGWLRIPRITLCMSNLMPHARRTDRHSTFPSLSVFDG